MKIILLNCLLALCICTTVLSASSYPFPNQGYSPALVLPTRSDTCVASQRNQGAAVGAALGGITGLLASQGKAGYGLAGALVGGLIGASSGAHHAQHMRYQQSQDEVYANWMCQHYDPSRHNEFVSCVHYSSLPSEWKRRLICHFNYLYDQFYYGYR